MKNIIIKPLITEKATLAQEKYNRYSFVVDSNVNKYVIKSQVRARITLKLRILKP